MRQANIQMYRDEVRNHSLVQKQQQILRAKQAAGIDVGDAIIEKRESEQERRKRQLVSQ